VKDETLTAADFKAGALPAGTQGEREGPSGRGFASSPEQPTEAELERPKRLAAATA